MSRQTISSKVQEEARERLIDEVCKYRRMGDGPFEIYQKITVGCTRASEEALSYKYDYFCKWRKDVRELLGLDEERT